MPKSLPLVLLLFAVAIADAGPIRYEEIPAEATGYIHVDFEKLITSRIWKQAVREKDADRLAFAFGKHWDFTAYTLSIPDEPDAMVTLWHISDAEIRARMHNRIPTTEPAKGDGETGFWDRWYADYAESHAGIPFTYRKHAAWYAPIGLERLLWADRDSHLPEPFMYMTTQPSSGGAAMAPEAAPNGVLDRLSMGSAGGNLIYNGPLYIAFVKPDLVITATCIPALAEALDVVDGRRPSLTASDPHGLRMSSPAGVMIQAAGLTADALASLEHGRSGTDGSLAAKARVGRFDFGEDEQHVYCDAIFSMNDAAAAEQLKNLIAGLKAFTEYSKDEVGALIVSDLADPLQANVSGTEVDVHWSWPTNNLPKLVILAKGTLFRHMPQGGDR